MSTNIPSEYLKWQSAKNEKGEFIIGHMNHINRWLGTGIKSGPWEAVHNYLPTNIEKISDYQKYTISSIYLSLIHI